MTNKTIRLIGMLAIILTAVFTAFGSAPAYADSKWDAKYWNNRDMAGDPALQRQDSDINFNWGSGTPAAEITSLDFSARWKRTVNFAPGTYRFTATVNDGMRVWIDDTLIMEDWRDGVARTFNKDVTLTGGNHEITVRYYNHGGTAEARFSWTQIAADIAGWRGEYFNNKNLSGTPAMVRDDATIDFNWGNGSPKSNTIQSDQFSVRWTDDLNLTPGRYRFTTTTDDGVRLWVNGQMLIDKWFDQAATSYSGEIELSNGKAAVRMEYYDNGGGALARLAVTRVGGPSSEGPWQGEYFNNRNLSGSPSLVRNEANIDFNWGNGSPAPGLLANDNFSVRWTGNLNLAAGRYRFTAKTDDGVRVWVNNQLIVDHWADQAAQERNGEISLPGGVVPVRMEYFDHGGDARARLTWTQINGGTQPPTSGNGIGANATVTAGRLNVRLGPGVQYGIVTVVSSGQSLPLSGFRNSDAGWVQVLLSNGTAGWVSARYIQTSYPLANLTVWTGQPPNTGGPSNTATAVVNTGRLNMRTGPSLGHSVITTLNRDTVVQLTGIRNADATWVQVTLADGRRGWMSARYLVSTFPFNQLTVGS